MERNFIYELQQIGLDKNQASVYLAALELGPSPVQKIALRARVPRATTYLVLDELKKKGLVSTYEQGKKEYYNAQHPSQLEGYLKKQESELLVKQKALESLVPELERRGQFPETLRPHVRYYEGKDAVAAYRKDILRDRKNQKVVRAILDTDGLKKIIGDLGDFAQRRVKENVRSRVIYVDPSGNNPMNSEDVLREAKSASSENFPVPADVSIIGNSIGFMPYEEPYRAVIIDDAVIAQSLVSLFELAWKGAEAIEKERNSGK